MSDLKITILRYVDDTLPGWVEYELRDASNYTHLFREKVPVVTKENLGAGSAYPQSGVMACEIIGRWFDNQARIVLRVRTDRPWGCESSEGTTVFDVLPEQLVGDSIPSANMLRFWVTVPFDLKEIERRFAIEFGLSDSSFDYENVYTWFEAQSPSGVEFNVSRQHDWENERYDEPVQIVLTPFPLDIQAFGQRMAQSLGCKVHYGTVENPHDDEFRFLPLNTFIPGHHRINHT